MLLDMGTGDKWTMDMGTARGSQERHEIENLWGLTCSYVFVTTCLNLTTFDLGEVRWRGQVRVKGERASEGERVRAVAGWERGTMEVLKVGSVAWGEVVRW